MSDYSEEFNPEVALFDMRRDWVASKGGDPDAPQTGARRKVVEPTDDDFTVTPVKEREAGKVTQAFILSHNPNNSELTNKLIRETVLGENAKGVEVDFPITLETPGIKELP